MGALIWGIVVFIQEKSSKRRELAFQMLNEIEDNDKIRVAMAILYDVKVKIPGTDKEYALSQLEEVLKTYSSSHITDIGEIEIRKSFEALLSFFDKVALQLFMGAIKEKELKYFRVCLVKMKGCTPLNLYARRYGYINYIEMIDKVKIQE